MLKCLTFMVTLTLSCQAFGIWRITIGDSAMGKQPISVASAATQVPPDFSAFQEVQQKKRAFYDFMLPLIRHANKNILTQRNDIEALENKLAKGIALNGGDHQRLKQLFTQYRLEVPVRIESRHLRSLLERVDVVPESLLLAQSANESGWGTSRFAVEANNYFGIWCFKSGCGMVPASRGAGLRHEVASYSSVQDGVSDYLLTLNTHSAYHHLRGIRAQNRIQKIPHQGLTLAMGLTRYSVRGKDYIQHIQGIIRVNQLERFTLAIRV